MRNKSYFLLLFGIVFLYGCSDPDKLFRSACANGNEAEVKKIIKSGKVDINKKAISNGPTPLMIACERKKSETVKLLLDNGADVNIKMGMDYTALFYAIENSEIVKILLDHDADVNVKTYNGRTALLLSSWFGYYKTVEVLLQFKAEVNISDNDGKTALDKAVEKNHKEIIDLLKSHGAKTAAELKAENSAPKDGK